MRFYKITVDLPDRKPRYRPTLDAAKDHVKATEIPESYNFVRIELVEIEINQKTVADILSCWGCPEEVLRTWSITPRGGIKEIENGE